MQKRTLFTPTIIAVAVIIFLIALYYINSQQIILPIPTSTTTYLSMTTSTYPSTTTVYPSEYPVRILSVNTIPSTLQVNDFIDINTTFQNIANYPIYYIYGCGSSLEISSYTPTNNIQKVFGPACACASRLSMLNSSQIANAYAPNCANGYSLKISKLGTITFNLTLYWGITQNNFDKSISFPYSINVNSINTATTTPFQTTSSGSGTATATAISSYP